MKLFLHPGVSYERPRINNRNSIRPMSKWVSGKRNFCSYFCPLIVLSGMLNIYLQTVTPISTASRELFLTSKDPFFPIWQFPFRLILKSQHKLISCKIQRNAILHGFLCAVCKICINYIITPRRFFSWATRTCRTTGSWPTSCSLLVNRLP